jgi:Flp pilus assembly pilin Flp
MKRRVVRQLRGARGAVTTEYTVLVGTVALGAAVALVGLGVAFVNSFEHVRGYVLYPFP